MEYEIARLLFDYSLNGKIVDKQYADKLIDIVVNNRNLDDYVSRVTFTNKFKKDDEGIECAKYDPINKLIIVDYESVLLLLDYKSVYEVLFKDIETIMYKNLLITQVLLHELEHANQYKQVDNKLDDSVEKRLCKACLLLGYILKNPELSSKIIDDTLTTEDFKFLIDNHHIMYKRYYQFDPTERMAQVKSYRTIVSAIEPFKIHTQNLYEFENASLVEQMIRGYEDSWNEGVCPTQVYLSAIGRKNTWEGLASKENFEINDQKTLSKRMTYGLPISYGEFDLANDWLRGTNKYNI